VYAIDKICNYMKHKHCLGNRTKLTITIKVGSIKKAVHCRFAPDQCVPEEKFMDNAFFMDDVPFGTLRSLDDSSFWQCTYDPLYWWGANVTSGKRRLGYPGWTQDRVTQVFGVITHRLYAAQGRDASVRDASCRTFCWGHIGPVIHYHDIKKTKGKGGNSGYALYWLEFVFGIFHKYYPFCFSGGSTK
jgi:hypothetical protein